MSDDSQNRTDQRTGAERRSSPRYRLSPPPEIEVLHTESGPLAEARLGDLSRGGCYIETERPLPVGTEVTVAFKKGGDLVRAQARVVRAFPNRGLGLEFTSMEGSEFRILDSWLSAYVATTWAVVDRRRADRVAMEVDVKISGYNSEGARFTEDTHTIEISAFGGLVILQTPVKRGQRLVLSNPKTKVMVECMVAHHTVEANVRLVGLAFIVLNQPFWPIKFPPADWSSRPPDAPKYGS